MSSGNRIMSLEIKEEEEDDDGSSITTEEEWKLRLKEEPSTQFYEGLTTVKEEDVKVELVEEEDLVAVADVIHFEQDPLDISHEAVHEKAVRDLHEQEPVEDDTDSVEGLLRFAPDTFGISHEVFREEQQQTDDENLKKRKELKRHVEALTVKPYICHVCERKFAYSSSLKVHMRKHTGERPFSCVICKESFVYQQYWKAHMRSHPKAEPLRCPVCQAIFIKSSTLSAHVRFFTKEEPVGSDICGKELSGSTDVRHNMIPHTREKLYECRICMKTLSRTGFEQHVRRNHKISCQFCKASFGGPSGLAAHVRIHMVEKPYSCDICGKKFSRSMALKRHDCSHPRKAT